MPEKTMTNGNIVKILLVVGFAVLVGFQVLVLTGGLQVGSNINFDFAHTGVTSASGNGVITKLSLDTAGYNQLLEYDKTITLTDAQKKNYAGFDVLIPCCGFQLTSQDENNDCRCGHHIALAGLIKWGLTNGKSRDQIQQEINQWKPVFFPECLSQKSLCDL